MPSTDAPTPDHRAAISAAALDASSCAMMVCNGQRRIEDVNTAWIHLAQVHANDLSQFFASSRRNDVIGMSLDRLAPGLASRPAPYRQTVKLGSAWLELSATPFSVDGEEFVCIQWTDDTAQKRYADELERLVQAVGQGDLSARGDIDHQLGKYPAMLQSVNDVVDVMATPILTAVEAVQRVAVGRTATEIELDQGGTFGELVTGINTLIRTTSQITEVAERIADGDLTMEVSQRSDSDALMGALKRMVEDLNRVMQQVQGASRQLDLGSAQVSEAGQSLADNASRSAASLEQIAATMEEISVQTQENARNATSALDLSTRARKSATLGDQQMHTMVAAMVEIEESSRNISKIIKVIDDIAFQTNLLALNAAVEAGRAGVHGRGFAVVAEEVRRLAARSAQAAKETTEMIEGSTTRVNQGRVIAEETADSLAAIVSSVAEVSDLVGEIAAASQEQAAGIGEVNEALGQVDAATQGNTAKAEEMAAASRDLSSQSSLLADQIGRFRLAGQSAYEAAPPSMPRHVPQGGQPFEMPMDPGPPSYGSSSLNDGDFGEF